MSSEKGFSLNPCTTCGACCAYFRVQFYWREVEKESLHKVPERLTQDVDTFLKCMRGTGKKRNNHCIALKGRIGKQAICTIYNNRPSVCRKFSASYIDGKPNKRCDEARAAHGLKALRPEDWAPTTSPVSSDLTPLPMTLNDSASLGESAADTDEASL